MSSRSRSRRRYRSRSGGNGTTNGWLAAGGVIILLAVTVTLVTFATAPTAPPADAAKSRWTPAPAAAPAIEIPEFVRPTDRPLGIVFAGDSLTYGLFASSEAAGYRPQVIAALEAGGPVDWSRGGQTGNKIQTVSDSITFPATTDIAILELGTNDVFKTPATDIPAQYDALMAKVKASAPAARIICLGVWSNVDGRRNWDAPIQASCEAGGGTFLPLGNAYDAAESRGPAGVEAFGGVSDDFHPNDKGYGMIASITLKALGLAE
jgi:acyl-CoA thioesterase-1